MWREQRILALAKFGVVEVDREGELVDGHGIGEGRFEEVCLRFLVDRRFAVVLLRPSFASQSQVAAIPGVLAGLAPYVRERVRPHELVEAVGNSSEVHEGVSHVDEKLKGQGEAIAEQPCGDEDGVRAVEADVTVADRLISKLSGIRLSDHGGFTGTAIAERQWDEVV